MDQFFEGLKNIAITVCDADANILDMNQHSADVNSHGHKIIGNNLMDCHPEPAKTKLKGLLAEQKLNAYTIEKTLADGSKVKKLIYQTPWYEADGSFGGLVEYSIEIPFEMPHYVRQPKVQ
ncbi:MAG: PAS domain-containing protein [Bacteroidales bacterium]|jgi:transcriptional regulator with PAS, ATPase and Fis domain|nr:PAS domain-containing protein [Bacteroidales bacterium]